MKSYARRVRLINYILFVILVVFEINIYSMNIHAYTFTRELIPSKIFKIYKA